jgi:chemotaxis protein methyltransferase CheR
MAIAAADFDYVRTLVCQSSGIVLDHGKEYLVESRLGPLARRLQLPSIAAVVEGLRKGHNAALTNSVIEAMTTNETTFFRDVAPFDALRTGVLPRLIEARQSARSLRIWCAASSTGQEPYSLAMLLAEHFPALESWDVSIMASDLSTDVLDRARTGRYSQLEVNRGLPATFLVKYFDKQGAEWQLKDYIRKRVTFQQLNLIKAWPYMPALDIVLIRNVMIYFDVETKRDILGRIRRLLRSDGFLFLGAAETTLTLDASFERMQFERAGCYRLAA